VASDNNWSSCASCHPGGGSDGITWSFGTGPRQTLPLDASYSKADPTRQRVFNWNAERGSVTDFNNNARGVQGGKGFTKDPAADAGQVFNHGPSTGVSDALDLMTLWVQVGVRTPDAPAAVGSGTVAAGRAAFEGLGCAECHGGDQWTSSRVRWAYPLFAADPAGATTPNEPLDPRVKRTASFLLAFDANANASFDDDADGFDDLPIVTRFRVAGQAAPQSPTLDLTSPIELRGAGALIAQNSVGAAASFNPPSLLGLAATAPYGHHGRAETIEAVFAPLSDGGLNHPSNGASPQQLADLKAFLLSIDATTPPVD
jgi:cytochrome c peroxidase